MNQPDSDMPDRVDLSALSADGAEERIARGVVREIAQRESSALSAALGVARPALVAAVAVVVAAVVILGRAPSPGLSARASIADAAIEFGVAAPFAAALEEGAAHPRAAELLMSYGRQ